MKTLFQVRLKRLNGLALDDEAIFMKLPNIITTRACMSQPPSWPWASMRHSGVN